jgi:hypothetical protein
MIKQKDSIAYILNQNMKIHLTNKNYWNKITIPFSIIRFKFQKLVHSLKIESIVIQFKNQINIIYRMINLIF